MAMNQTKMCGTLQPKCYSWSIYTTVSRGASPGMQKDVSQVVQSSLTCSGWGMQGTRDGKFGQLPAVSFLRRHV